MSTKTKKKLSKPQEIQVELMRISTFNDFDGDFVADSLLEHRDLWLGFILDREAYSAEWQRRKIVEEGISGRLPVCPIDTIRLRDIAAGYWNVDALFVLPAPGREDELLALAQTWRADEVDWCDPTDASFVSYNSPKIGESFVGAKVEKMLRVWWD